MLLFIRKTIGYGLILASCYTAIFLAFISLKIGSFGPDIRTAVLAWAAIILHLIIGILLVKYDL